MTGPGALGGRYELVDLLGRGGMGTVWRALDRRTGRWVALKVLGRHDAGLLLRFVQEQGVRIHHPHVATPTGWVADDDRVAFAMELARGGTVHDLLAEHGRLPEPLVAELLDQLLQGLAAVHDAGLVHRDLKPANLLLEATGLGRPHLRIGDFGVAASRAGPRFTHVPGSLGTPGYGAPQQDDGAPPEPRHDLYAVGVIGVELLTGLAPGVQPGSAPPGRLRPVLAALIAPEPADRPPSAAAALALLRARGVVWRETGVRVPDRVGPPPAAAPTHRTAHRTADRLARSAPALLRAAVGCLVGSVGLSGAATWQALVR